MQIHWSDLHDIVFNVLSDNKNCCYKIVETTHVG